MAWLDEVDLYAARRLRSELQQARTELQLRRAALSATAELVPVDVLSWNRISPTSGAVEHESVPADAEPPGAFAAVVGTAAQHPLLAAHAIRPGATLRLSEAAEPRRLAHSELYGELLHRSGAEYGISIGLQSTPDESVVVALGRHEREFSERDRDVLDLVRPAVEDALRSARARERLVRALASHPPAGTAVVLLDRYGEIEQSSIDAERWLAEHFGPAQHPGWLPDPVASWLALPPRPPLVSVREGRRLTVQLLPGDPHALLVEEQVESFRPSALQELGLTGRERDLLDAARGVREEASLADELFLSPHAVREQLGRVQDKLGVRTAADAIAAALRAST
jgi:DNA-binding CsgD family transcriptional regulator